MSKGKTLKAVLKNAVYNHKGKGKGFSLAEVAIGLALLGIAAVGLVGWQVNEFKHAKAKEIASTLQAVDASLYQVESLLGYIPKPTNADFTQTTTQDNDTTYGCILRNTDSFRHLLQQSSNPPSGGSSSQASQGSSFFLTVNDAYSYYNTYIRPYANRMFLGYLMYYRYIRNVDTREYFNGFITYYPIYDRWWHVYTNVPLFFYVRSSDLNYIRSFNFSCTYNGGLVYNQYGLNGELFCDLPIVAFTNEGTQRFSYYEMLTTVDRYGQYIWTTPQKGIYQRFTPTYKTIRGVSMRTYPSDSLFYLLPEEELRRLRCGELRYTNNVILMGTLSSRPNHGTVLSASTNANSVPAYIYYDCGVSRNTQSMLENMSISTTINPTLLPQNLLDPRIDLKKLAEHGYKIRFNTQQDSNTFKLVSLTVDNVEKEVGKALQTMLGGSYDANSKTYTYSLNKNNGYKVQSVDITCR